LDHPLSFIFKIETPEVEFLMALPNGAGHGRRSHGEKLHFTIFRRIDGDWEFFDRVVTDSFLLPWMDIDGDGVPEMLYEAHDSILYGVFRFFPTYKNIVTLSGER